MSFLRRHVARQSLIQAARSIVLFLIASAAGAINQQAAGEVTRPNILWITSEDNSPWLGCYGDPVARTPNLDRLATEGLVFTRAYSNAPVCAVARSTLITGVYAPVLGLQHMRSRVEIPQRFQTYPEVLRAAGYYCINRHKTDYNIPGDHARYWDESSPEADYQNRKPGQPFLAVINLKHTHESRLFPGGFHGDWRPEPEDVLVPDYLPDLPEIREAIATNHGTIHQMDQHVGDILRELEDRGLAEDTIVYYYSDHGGAIPRSKRFLYPSGVQVPLIIRIPGKWKHLAPALGDPGTQSGQLVSFVDFPMTLFHWAGAAAPENYQGRNFLVDASRSFTPEVFLYSDRFDRRMGMKRSIVDDRFQYIRSYYPHRPDAVNLLVDYTRRMEAWTAWEAAVFAGKCAPQHARLWQAGSSEELYDLTTDPFCVNNLAEDPEHAEILRSMRTRCSERLLSLRDTGFIPEDMMSDQAGTKTIYDYAQSEEYLIGELVVLAERMAQGGSKAREANVKALNATSPVLRYWGAVNASVMPEMAKEQQARLLELLDDPYLSIRCVAAEALYRIGETEIARDFLRRIPDDGNQAASMYADHLALLIDQMSPESGN